MATNKYCCFKGRGKIHMVDAVAFAARVAGLVPAGNASVFEINVTESTETVKDYTSPAGGTHCNFREIDEVQGKMTLLCHTPLNLIRTLYGAGAADNVATAAVVGEPVTLFGGSIAPLANLIDESVPPVVKSADDVTTYALGTDYVITPAGSIEHVAGSTITPPVITAGVGAPNLKVSYTRKTQSVIQLAAKTSEPQFLHFDGFNVAETPQIAMQFSLYKLRLSTGATLQLVADQLSKLEFTFLAERDFSRPLGTLTNPLSQYGTLKI